ncbi:hypothetical protein THIOM_002470 [Candidatus Thiomargarita nelsonii]|uniref:Uncharacterized protein n=1 Tax=Candidatus Thiomargarita nelsonii TaxID=1003181 RepID=A0A176S118_9GAMM|nr:hypothetical protein THIOM_002470 [Candidatus Thiomargarita nelsonii]
MVTVAMSKFSPLIGSIRVIVKVSGISNCSSSIIVIVKVLSAESPSAQDNVPVVWM